MAALTVATGCENDTLHPAVDPPDLGFYADATPTPVPDAGFAPDAAEPPPAVEPVYIHTGSTLYGYLPGDNRAVEIGDFHTDQGEPPEMVDTAIDLEGKMYGGSRDERVFIVDPETAFCRFLFDFDDELNGLTFLADGRLVVAGERVSILDPRSGEVLDEIVTAQRYETSGDIVGLPDGKLYWTVRNRRDNGQTLSGDGVVRIDPVTHELRWLGVANIDRIYGLGYAEGMLLGFSSTGFVVTLNPGSGDVVDQQPLDGTWWGATTNPVRW